MPLLNNEPTKDDSMPTIDTAGRDDLWDWFGCSHASFCVMPRVLMHAMPDKWQADMAGLLNEADAAFPGVPDVGYSVRAMRDGRMVKMPPVLINYRHPDKAEIDYMREYRA